MDVHDSIIPAETIKLFWSKVDRSSGPDACWPWTAGSKGKPGYGCAPRSLGGGRAHRVAYRLTHGDIPVGLIIMHSCDNPPCCNPRHLLAGTYADNNRDCRQKNRHAWGDRNGTRTKPESRPRGQRHGYYTKPESRALHDKAISQYGEQNGSAKLVSAQVLDIRARSDAGATRASLSREFGVSETTIYEIATRRKWRHLEAAP